MIKTILISLLVPVLHASVVADPLSLHPDSRSDWFQVLNDDLVGKSHDNYLTAGVHGGVKMHEWHLGMEYDMYTDRAHERRIDSASTTLGKEITIADVLIIPSFGVQFNGNLGGQHIQSWWHRLTHVEKVKGDYEHSDWRPLGLITARYKKEYFWTIVRYEDDLHSHNVDAICALRYSDVVGSDPATYFIGPHYSYEWGSFPSNSHYETAQFYNEWSIVVGLETQPFIIDFQIGKKGSFGEIGFNF